METNYFHDLWLIAPLLCVILTGLTVLGVESVRKGSANQSYLISLIGLFAALMFTVFEDWTAQPAFNNMYLHSPYGAFFSIMFLGTGILTVLISRPYLERLNIHRSEYYLLILFSVAGMMLMASAMDLIIIFLGIELMSISLYVLAGFMRTNVQSNESALKYFLLGAFATGFLLYGIALVYGVTGTTNLETIASSFEQHVHNTVFLAGVGLMLVAFAFKVAAAPFHMWAPDVYEGAPTTVTAFMSTGVKAAGFAAFASIFLRTFEFSGTKVTEAIAIVAALSMIIGNVIALAQINLKRMLAYSSIAHAGYILVGIAASNSYGEAGILFYLVAYIIVNMGAFGIISLVEEKDGSKLTFDDYSGFSAQRPFLAGLMAIFMFSLAGIPPMAGFFGKYYVFLAAVKANMVWLAVIGVLTSLISVYYYLRLVVIMYFREGKADVAERPSYAVIVSIVVAAFLILQFGIYPSLIVDIAQQVF